jgi:hypothetical protein
MLRRKIEKYLEIVLQCIAWVGAPKEKTPEYSGVFH